jgi:hypothetical protein
MILHSIPEPETTREYLNGVLDAVWIALEYGLLKTREYFDQEGTEIDPWLAANITRYHARIYLEAHQLDTDYERIDLLNCGLRVVAVREHYRFDLWIRKADDGELPVPKSDSMQAFYYQPLLPGVFAANGATVIPVSQTIGLVALWETPPSYSHITSLSLVCPSQGGDSKADIQEHWSIPVPHPVTTTHTAEPTTSDEEPADDLDIDTDADAASGSGDDDDE